MSLQTFFLCPLLSGLDLFFASVQELLSHLILSLGLFGFKFEIALFVPLAPVGVIPKSGPCHGGSDVLDLIDSDGGESVVGEFHALVLFKKLNEQILVRQLMEAYEKRQPIALYEVPLLPEFEVKSLIIKALPQARLGIQNIILRKKQGKYQAFLMVPVSKVEEICILKTVTINKESVTIKKPITQAQVFIGRIPDSISIDEIKTLIESQFGKIVKIHEGQPYEESKSRLKHCYVQFVNSEDAQKFLFTPRRHLIKSFQLRPSRAYTINQSDETDKKLFLKVVSLYQDQDDLELVLNDEFRKEGKLREKIRVENGKATIVYINGSVADKVLHNFKGGKIGKYEVVLRPFASKDSYTAFLGGLKFSVSSQDLEQVFSDYQPLISCSIMHGSNNKHRNATITFGSKTAFTELLANYKDDPAIKEIFEKDAYITQHMSAKERNQYNQYRKGKVEKKVAGPGPVVPPSSMMGAYGMGFGMPQPQHSPFMAPLPRPNNYGPPPNQFYPM